MTCVYVQLQGFRDADKFILAQTPLSNTVQEFLSLVYQTDVTCIVCLDDPLYKAKVRTLVICIRFILYQGRYIAQSQGKNSSHLYSIYIISRPLHCTKPREHFSHLYSICLLSRPLRLTFK